MFKSATLRLTAWYIAILMVISSAFSVAIYITATQAVENGLHGGYRSGVYVEGPLQQQDDFWIYGRNVSDIVRARVLNDLIRVNLLIVVFGGLASYFLAKRTLRPIEEAVEAQSRFTADASHELRTPLTAMKTEIEVALMDKKLTGAQARDLLGSNLEEIEKLQQLSNGLLKLAQSNGDNVTSEEVLIKEVVNVGVDRLNKVIKQAEAKVEVSAGDQKVLGDKDSLVELVSILVDNAIKYSPKKETVTVTTARQGRSVLLSVQDRGQGIKATELPHIFERFYRADTSRSKKKIGGYGLGLSIAQQIVKLHHGSITVESALGKGTTFIVRLPLADNT